ncbi:MAG: ABC transporter permease [Actinomycetota bacterium]|nr:ABC transporter permease [Actinomycetota bacterium]
MRQVRYTNRAFWRNPASAFFTFVFPLMFLVIFTALLGSGEVEFAKVPVPGHGLVPLVLDQATYFVAAMAAFGVISATYTNIAITTAFQRDQGILKRLRGTPLPSWSYLFARVVHSMLVALILVVITLVFGKLAYGTDLPTGGPVLEFLVTLVVGSLSFAAMALALTAVIPNADAAPPIVNATILPLLFLSGIFVPLTDRAPAWITTVGNIFPVKHFADAMRAGYLGNVTLQGTGVRAYPFEWSDLAVVAAWGVVGLILASRFFSWEPRK